MIHEKDAEQILLLAEAIKSDFAVNLVEGKKITSTNTRGNSKKYQAKNVADDIPDNYWATDDSVIVSSITVDFGEPTEFNRFLVQEDIRFGQRVKQFTLEVFSENEWKQIDAQTTIGRKRILRFPNVTAGQLRLNIKDSRACPVISKIGVYKAPKVIVEPEIQRNKNGEVSIQGFDSGIDIFYTIDGSYPTAQSFIYTEPFLLKKKATVKAIVVDPGSKAGSPVSEVQFDISKENWKLTGAFESAEQARFIFDGNPKTAWTLDILPPVDFIIDLSETLNITGFTYLPDQGRWNPGIINRYEFYVSKDGKNWGNPVSEGDFANIKNNPVLQKKDFDVVQGRFVKFRALSPAEEKGRLGIAEFDIITQ